MFMHLALIIDSALNLDAIFDFHNPSKTTTKNFIVRFQNYNQP